MDKLIKKKLKFVLIGFLIALIPIGYWIYSSIVFEKANEAFNEANFSNDKIVINESIKEIDRALKIIPWSRFLKSCKYSLHYKIGDYYKALGYAKKRNDYDFISLIYESMDKPDSAKIYYHYQINVLKSALKKEDKEFRILLLGRQLALLYTFIGDSISAKKYLADLSQADYSTRKYMLKYDYYIENYISGGYSDYLYGITICMKNDSLSDKYTIDSLIDSHRFYYDNYTSEQTKGQDKKAVYEFKEIFEDKATSIGFKEIDCNERELKMNIK